MRVIFDDESFAAHRFGQGAIGLGMSVALAPRRDASSIALPEARSVGAFALALSLSSVGAVLWAGSLSGIVLEDMSGLGLVSVLSPESLVAMGLSAAGFYVALNQRRLVTALLALQLATWVVMLHGINSLVAPEPVFGVAWRHAGITDYIVRNRVLDPNIDAYFSWPGFFGLSALVTKAAALASPVALIRWSPVFFNLLYLAPLALIFKAATSDKRTVWLALWFFYTMNWIGQDYFSPQALAYFAYLLVLGVLLKWFVPSGAPSLPRLRRRARAGKHTMQRSPPVELKGDEAGELEEGRSGRALAAAAVVLVFASTVTSHQLTPFALVLAASLLAGTRLIALRALPVLMAVMVGVWISYMTTTFLAGHLDMVFKPLGLQESAAVNVQGRLQGSPEHVVVVYGRLATAAAVWLLAVLGAWRSRQRTSRFLACLALAIAPFPLLVLQPYGGEMLLRVYLLSLPFCALFLAGLFVGPRPASALGTARSCCALLVTLLLITGFLVSRYGNQTIDFFTREEVEAVSQLYRIAPPGSLLVAGEGNLPWKYRDYGGYEYRTLEEYDLEFSSEHELARSVARTLETAGVRVGYLIVTRSQKETVRLLGVPAPSKTYAAGSDGTPWLTYLESVLQSSPEFEVVFENRDATIFSLRS